MMTRRPRHLVKLFVVTAMVGIGGVIWWGVSAYRVHTSSTSAARRTPVRRMNLSESIRAGGRIESARKTLIECELENIRVSSEGRGLSSGSRTRIIELVPEGTEVHRGDVLCRLDSSIYEEMVVQQKLKVTQAENDHRRAELDAVADEIALSEYREGLLPRELESLDGQVVLAEVDLQRQTDRVDWSSKMLAAGYLSDGQHQAEVQKLLRAEIMVRNAKGQKQVLQRYRAPINTTRLEMAVASSLQSVEFQEMRHRREKERLAKLLKQVDLCTVRAPHDGFVIYADEDDDEPLAEGIEVHQKMDLFYLPDLNDMQVQALLNESVVERVKPNMMVRVRAEGLPGREMEGHVVSVANLPAMLPGIGRFSNVRSYVGTIRLHSPPKGLMPGMTAEVVIEAGGASGALVIPSEAAFAREGRDYCLVDGPEGVQRRELSLGRTSSDLTEVRSGLEEGETIIRDPHLLDPSVLEVAENTDRSAIEPEAPTR